MPIGPITRARAKKLKEVLNWLVQNICSKIDLEEFGTSKKHEGQPLIHLIQVQHDPNSYGITKHEVCVWPHTSLVRLILPKDTKIENFRRI